MPPRTNLKGDVSHRVLRVMAIVKGKIQKWNLCAKDNIFPSVACANLIKALVVHLEKIVPEINSRSPLQMLR